MNLYYPLFLWVLAAAAFPVIIHMLFRKKSRSIEFSTLRFLSAEAVISSRRSRLKKWFLLLLRILIILLIVFLFATPYRSGMPADVIYNPNVEIYCWIDPTLSMDYEKDGTSLWREGVSLSVMLDTVLPRESVVKNWNSAEGLFVDRKNNRDSDRSYVKYGNCNVSEVLDRFESISRKLKKIPVLVLISDFQTGTAEQIEDYIQKKGLKEYCFFVNLSEKNAWNYSVSEPALTGAGGTLLRCKVKAFGESLDSTVLTVEQGGMRTGYKTISVPPDDFLETEINTASEGAAEGGSVLLDVKDNLMEDNRCYFSERDDDKKALLVISDYRKAFPLIAVFRNIKKPVWNELLIREPENVTYSDIEKSDIIVINAVSEISDEINSLLSDNVRDRKLILYSPASADKQGSLNNAVFRMTSGLKTVKNIKKAEPAYLRLPDTISMLWKGFPRINVKEVSVYNYLSPITGEKLCLLNNGDAFVSFYSGAKGHMWIMLASSIGITNDNNICETGFYLPFLDRLVRYGAQKLSGRERSGWVAGVSKKNPYYGSSSFARIVDTNDNLVSVWKNQPRVKIELPGIYKVIPDDGESRNISVNINPVESNTEYRYPDFDNVSDKNSMKFTGEEFAQYLSDGSTKTQLSNVLWIFLLVLIVLEPLFWGWGREKGDL